MNKQTIISLLNDGAYFNVSTYQIFHTSFRKGFRKLSPSNISWVAVEREHGIFGSQRLVRENGIFRLNPANQSTR
jgi:hypothetical protein